MLGRREKCMNIFIYKPVRKNQLGRPGAVGRIILEWILKK
jgi:hypothetical protein